MTSAEFEVVKAFSSYDGTKIAYRDAGQGPIVLMHHGFASDSRTNWIRTGVAQAVLEMGRRVVLIDARGHGDSEKPHDPGAYAGGAMVRDVRALLDHVDAQRVDLVGYSMGSLVAVGVATREPRVRSLVLGGAGTRQVSVSDPGQAGRIAEGLEVADKSEISDPTARAFRNFADATGADRLALAAIQRARSGPPSGSTLASISVPTLVINGEKDTLVGDLDSLARAIPGALLKVVPGDHISAVVKPEFRNALVDFLRVREG